MNKVVIHTTQGEVIKGFTTDFAKTKSSFMLTSQEDSLRINQTIEMKDLKAVFFVKTFEGNFLRKKTLYFKDDTSYGTRVIVTFKDGEEFYGRMESLQTNTEHNGFFVFPLDSNSNIIRAFVLKKYIVNIQVINQ